MYIKPSKVVALVINPTVIWRPHQRNPREYPHISYIFLETSIIDLHFAADSFCLSSFEFFWQAPKDYFISARVTFRRFKVVQGR